MSENKKIVFTAGGTGGHLFPASAVAREMKKNGYKVYLLTDKRGKRFTEDGIYEKVISIPAGAIVGKSKLFKILSLVKLGFGLGFAKWRILTINPKVVIGFGGYTTVPVIIAGWLFKKRTIIHSADSVMGLSNKLLCRFAREILTSFEGVKGIPAGNDSKIVYTGLPIRENILKIKSEGSYSVPNLSKGEKFNIIITGGSQGSKALGEDVAKGFALLSDSLRGQLNISHQVREEDIEAVKKIYSDAGMIDCVDCKPFLNMGELYKNCHLFVGRSGASSVVENAFLNVPSIFAPLWHKDRQQFLNAEKMENVGGAEIIEPTEFSAEKFSQVIGRLLNEKILLTMSENLNKLEVKDGRVEIAQLLNGIMLGK